MTTTKPDLFDGKRYDVEHALNMHAIRYFHFPATDLYNDALFAPHGDLVANCHVYLIGFAADVKLVGARQDGASLALTYEVLGKTHEISIPMPPGGTLEVEDDGGWIVRDGEGHRRWPNQELCVRRLLIEHRVPTFLVKYVGQAFGKEGSRNALTRLRSHDTLQKIAVLGVPQGYTLGIVMLEVEPNNQVITVFNPRAENKEEGAERINNGLDKLFNTTEAERVSLYEAALIRYFSPEFNKEFKDSFPSTNLKILQDCYAKDFAAVNAELNLEDMPFLFCSEAVDPSVFHFAFHNLHSDDDRKAFFQV